MLGWIFQREDEPIVFMMILSLLLTITPIQDTAVFYTVNMKKQITADAETDPVESWFDAADDPAIWVNPTDPNKTRLIGTDKKWGLFVYNLKGREVGAYPVGEINNVDVRYDFPLGNQKVDIVGGTNRSDNTISLFSISGNGQLSNLNGAPIKPSMKEIYGFGFYHSLRTGKYYALVVGKEGEFEQYELFDNGKGKVEGKKVRSFKLASQSEGVVADDEYGIMYIGEEDVAIWKYDAEPEGSTPTPVDFVKNGRLTADVEGLTLYYGENGKGYLLASSQGDNSYAIYEREGNNKYVGSFEIVDGKVDGVSDSDGIDVTSFGLGKEFPYGLFITQDGFNNDGLLIRNQNFKLVSWKKIADMLGLRIDTKVDPRKLILRSTE